MKNSFNIFKKEWNEIENFLLEIHLNKRQDKYTFTTGEFGMFLFARAINLKLENASMMPVNMSFKDTNEQEELIKGSQFVIYKFPNGMEIKIQHDPILDKKEDINSESGFPNKSSILYYEES